LAVRDTMNRSKFAGRLICTLLAGILLGQASLQEARADTELRIGMTLADIPLVTGQPSGGGEGTRFFGVTIYDSLVEWDLSRADVPPKLVPGLATDWQVDATDKRLWTITLRKGVLFHDGSEWNADVAIFNFEKLLDQSKPHYDPAQAAQAVVFTAEIDGFKKIDDYTIQIRTKSSYPILPYQLAQIFFSSRANYERLGDWKQVALHPAGTGPWKVEKVIPREQAILVKNAKYWDERRIPKTDRLVLLPIPEASTRAAALLSKSVDWIEAPSGDSLEKLKSSGFRISTNTYPHVWPWVFSYVEGSPLSDIRVRKAINLAIDREGIVNLLGGLAVPAQGQVAPSSPWFGSPGFKLRYDPKEAVRLLAEAGYSKEKPVELKVIIAPSGSGQMDPLPMNELIQQNLAEVGVKVTFEVLEWEALRGRRRAGASAPVNKGIAAINNSWASWDPEIGLIGPATSTGSTGWNWGGFKDAEIDRLGEEFKVSFDLQEQNRILAKIHTKMVDEAMWLWVVYDVQPRAMSSKIRGFVQAQSWFQDLTSISIVP
jgi:peptide/nickel transport system substrate-binding protein